MKNILFVTADLPSFNRPLGRTAGLIFELAQRHQLNLAYFDQGELNEADLKAASQICSRVFCLAASPTSQLSQNDETVLQLGNLKPEIILSNDPSLNPLIQSLLRDAPETQLITLRPYSIETPGQQFPFTAGLDAVYFRRQTPVNITSKLFLFPIQIDPLAKNDALISRRAIHYLIQRAWPEVLRHHPDATLRIVIQGDPADFSGEIQQGEGWQFEYGTIQPQEYEAARLIVAPYRDNVPLSIQPWLEAWAMQVPLITLPAAALRLEKLGAKLGDHFLKGEDGPSLAALMSRLLEIRRPGLHLAEAGRKLIDERFSWLAWAARIEELFAKE
jgi:hypothetical protein